MITRNLGERGDTEYQDYVFANWGEKVRVLDCTNNLRDGVITEFDPSSKEDTKVVYQDGHFDWYPRVDIEAFMREMEIIKSKEHEEKI